MSRLRAGCPSLFMAAYRSIGPSLDSAECARRVLVPHAACHFSCLSRNPVRQIQPTHAPELSLCMICWGNECSSELSKSVRPLSSLMHHPTHHCHTGSQSHLDLGNNRGACQHAPVSMWGHFACTRKEERLRMTLLSNYSSWL